jgi:hypothetical protein
MYDRVKEIYPDFFYGTVGGVFIDDTGSPGLQTATLDPKRKTWVSVYVSPSQMPEVMEQLPRAVDELSELTGATEFHFAEIWGRKREFESVPKNARIGAFRFMAWLFNRYRFPIHVQTLTPDSPAADFAKTELPSTALGPLDLTNHDHFALCCLLHMTGNYLKNNHPSSQSRVFSDSISPGFRSHGRALRIPGLSSSFKDDLVCFADSKVVPAIQLADFAAFCVNKQQLLLDKNSDLSEGEWKRLEICTSANFNFINIPVVQTNRKLWNREQ